MKIEDSSLLRTAKYHTENDTKNVMGTNISETPKEVL